MKKNRLLFFVFPLLCFSVTSVRAEDSLLKIQALSDQSSAKSGMMFLIHAKVTNSSADTSTDFWGNTCSYEKHWVTDNPAVFLQSWTCAENSLEQITLEPGDTYEKNIILYIPKKDKTGPVTFRLGFKRMSEDGDVAEPLWSDPVTMDVTVPEEMKAAASNADKTSQAGDQDPAKPAEVKETPQTGEMSENPQAAPSDSAVPAKSQALVFQDPGVPIKVAPGKEFSILLVSNPSTGFRWKMTLPEGDKTVMFLKSEHVASREVMPGVPGNEVFKFKALTVGETKASFVYERPWETKTAPTRKVFTLLVQEE